MNRRERKHLEKQLGLDKFYKKMSLAQRMKKMSDNIEVGKRTHEEHLKRVAVSLQQQDDEKESAIITSIAERIVKNEKIPLIDAMVRAKEERKNKKNSV